MRQLIKHLLMLFAVQVLNLPVKAQQRDSVREYIDSALWFMQHKSLFADKINWEQARNLAYTRAANASSLNQAFPAVAEIFKKLEDYHGMLSLADTSYRYPPPLNFDSILTQSIKQAFLAGPKIVKAFFNGIGYIRVPSMNVITQEDINSHANNLRDSLNGLLQEHPRGLIIDLRMNSGGNFAPMLAGISPLFTSDTLGYGVDRRGKLLPPVVLNDGVPVDEQGNKQVSVNSHFFKAGNIPIAVLTGYSTISSGEILAVFLKQQENVRLFGDRTGGFCNATEGFVFAGGQAYLLLSVNKIADAKKHVYNDMFVVPNFYIKKGDNYIAPANDSAVQAAAKWINNHRQ